MGGDADVIGNTVARKIFGLPQATAAAWRIATFSDVSGISDASYCSPFSVLSDAVAAHAIVQI